MSTQELDAVQWYLDFHLAKKFIQASSVSYSLPVLFIKKIKERIQFYVDYKRLNAITKKNYYLIPLIKEILTQIESTK